MKEDLLIMTSAHARNDITNDGPKIKPWEGGGGRGPWIYFFILTIPWCAITIDPLDTNFAVFQDKKWW